MKLCAREDCFGELKGRGRRSYCSPYCSSLAKAERDAGYRAKRRGRPAVIQPGYGFDVGLSRHWLSRAIA